MKVVGYSGKPLIDKLGYKPTETVYVYNTPPFFDKYLLKQGVRLVKELPADWVHVFVTNRQKLEIILEQLGLEKIKKAMWLSWPKRVSKMPTDITEQTLRDLILPLGWVDIKVIAVDETWSGLKFSRRKDLG